MLETQKIAFRLILGWGIQIGSCISNIFNIWPPVVTSWYGMVWSAMVRYVLCCVAFGHTALGTYNTAVLREKALTTDFRKSKNARYSSKHEKHSADQLFMVIFAYFLFIYPKLRRERF